MLNRTFIIAKKFIMNKFNRARKLFGSIDFSSDSSNESVFYISSEDEASDGWNSDWSTDTEEMITRVETQVKARPMPKTGRRMTTASDEPGTSAMPSELQITPKLDKAYFDENLCYAPPKGNAKRRIELCKTILPVRESPVSLPPHERGLSQDTPLLQTGTVAFTLPTTYRTPCPIRTSAPKDAQAAWYAEDL